MKNQENPGVGCFLTDHGRKLDARASKTESIYLKDYSNHGTMDSKMTKLGLFQRRHFFTIFDVLNFKIIIEELVCVNIVKH